MPIPSASSKIFWPCSIFFDCVQFFLNTFLIFWLLSKVIFYLINLHIWAWSKIFDHIQKYWTRSKKIDRNQNIFWTSRWMRHWPNFFWFDWNRPSGIYIWCFEINSFKICYITINSPLPTITQRSEGHFWFIFKNGYWLKCWHGEK